MFTDIMQTDNCNVEQMTPVYQRIKLDDMGSPGKYKAWAEKVGLSFVEFEDLSEQLPKHYGTVRQVLLAKKAEGLTVSDKFVDNMERGLMSWVEQAGNGNLAWGYLVFQKKA